MLSPGVSALELIYTNVGAGSTTPGTAVTPGASNVEGSATAIAASGDITANIYWVMISVSGGATSAASKMHLLDIGYDTAGGTSYTWFIENLACGMSSAWSNATATGQGRWFCFPLFIPAGSSVAVRIQGNAATAGTVQVGMYFYGRPDAPAAIKAATYAETIGTITNSNGPTFTPGTSGADGSWTLLGTTTSALWWFQVGLQADDATIGGGAAGFYDVDVAYGDGSNFVPIISRMMHIFLNIEAIGHPAWMPCVREVPAGSSIYIRARCSGTPDSSVNATVIGMGGDAG